MAETYAGLPQTYLLKKPAAVWCQKIYVNERKAVEVHKETSSERVLNASSPTKWVRLGTHLNGVA